MFQKKKVFSLIFISFMFPAVFAQIVNLGEPFVEVGSLSKEDDFSKEEDLELDDLDSLFIDAKDSEDAVLTDESKAGTDYNVQLGSIKFPIEVSGYLNTEFGGGYVRESMKNDATFYFDFKNYIYFSTRPDKYLALKGVFKTSMPEDDEDSSYESNNLFYLYEIYFEYLFFDKIYLTGGKKKSVWGNIRLFSSYEDYEDDDDALYTNVLYDSRRYISGIIKVPFGNNTFTGLAMYDDSKSSTSPGTKDMSFAFSAEFIIYKTAINIFGRRFPLNYGNDSESSQSPIMGIEFKRTIFGFDVYGQELARIANGYKTDEFFESKFSDKSVFNKIISTWGFYRLWMENIPYLGINFEYQNIYRPNPSVNADYFTNRFALEVGLAKLGKKRDIKAALQWGHNITDKSGFFQTGLIFSNALPHCDWRNGIKYEYDDESTSFNKYKLSLGSYLTVSLGY